MTEQPRATRLPCQVHGYHRPRPHINELHHVWPVGDGGPNIAANRIVTCSTGHNNIHALIDEYRRGTPGWEVLRHYAARERQLALLGWQRIQRQSM